MSDLAAALAKVQAEIPSVDKNKRAEVKGVTKDGKPFDRSYAYADLADVTAAIMTRMGPVGLSFTARPTLSAQGRFVLLYSLMHASGDEISGEYPLPDPDRTTPQQVGSAITYARRYCLCAVTGIAPDEDDDGHAAAEAKPAKPQRTRAKIPGPDHERLRQDTAQGRVNGTVRTHGPVPDPDNPWQDQPPGQLPKPFTGNGTIGIIAQHFARLEVTDRDERLHYTARLAGRDGITSSKDLTDVEQRSVMGRLSKLRDHAQLVALTEHGVVPAAGGTGA